VKDVKYVECRPCHVYGPSNGKKVQRCAICGTPMTPKKEEG